MLFFLKTIYPNYYMIKTIEQREKQLQLKLKQLEVKEKAYQLGEGLQQKCKDEKDRIIIEKLLSLQFLISSSMIDEDKTILGSEGVHKPVFLEEEMWILKSKILELVKKL
jgi:hypothetical protein